MRRGRVWYTAAITLVMMTGLFTITSFAAKGEKITAIKLEVKDNLQLGSALDEEDELEIETSSVRNGPCPVPRKPPPESSVPGKNLPRGSRRNQLRRGHGSPPVLGEVPHELSTAAHSKECKRSPQQFIPAGFPLHNQLPTGTEDSAIPLTTPDMVRSGRVPPTSVKSPFRLMDLQQF